MHLYVKSDGDKFPINAQVYEVDSLGNKYFVNRINYEGRKNTPGSLRVIDAEGNAHAHQFKMGNSIRIELTNLDMTNRKLLGWRPFVVPVFERSSTWIGMDASHPSYITLPLLETTPGTVTAASGTGQSVVPAEVRLEQNFPNPFNPTTQITYSLNEPAHVSLKIYNILGQEVMTLVDGMQPMGIGYATFDAGNLPSGVYFYRLQAGNFSQMRRMMVLK
jgi:hypothetical protein